jgi:hypothetical protein
MPKAETWEGAARRLAEPFPIDDIEFRIGSTSGGRGLLLPYITNRAIMDRLDEVFGLEGWQDDFERWGTEKGNICRIKVRLNAESEWITKTDGADDSDMEAFKGGLSNAEKRTGVKLGIGRYLYLLPKWWVALDGKYPAKGEEDRIRKQFPAWALPKGSGKPPQTIQRSNNGTKTTGEESPSTKDTPPEERPLTKTARLEVHKKLQSWYNESGYNPPLDDYDTVTKVHLLAATGKQSLKDLVSGDINKVLDKEAFEEKIKAHIRELEEDFSDAE